MGVKVTLGEASASVTSAKPRVSVVVVDPAVGVTYQVPVSALSYVELAVGLDYESPVAAVTHISPIAGAVLDTSGRFRYVSETTAVIDNIRLTASKVFADATSSIDDVVVLGTDKSLRDSVGFTEVVVRTLVYIRSFADAFSLSDRAALSLAKALVDSVQPTDRVAKDATKVVADSTSATDKAVLAPTKGLADSLSTTEFTTRAFIKALTDSALMTDAAARQFVKSLTDNFGTSERLYFEHIKSLSDGVGMSDSAEATDGLLVAMSKTIANVAFATDAMTRTNTKGTADSVAVADTGLLVTQGYCGFDYFAEDYVGVARSF